MEKTFEEWLDEGVGIAEEDGLDFDRPSPEFPAEYAQYRRDFEAGVSPCTVVDTMWDEIGRDSR